MIRIVFFLFFIVYSGNTFSQDSLQMSAGQLAVLQEKEQLLKKIAMVAFYSEEYPERRDANYTFIKEFRDALKVENSYNYPFKELTHLQILTPGDNSFRIITWQLQLPGKLVRHFGAIQMNETPLKIFPLIDRSDDMEAPANFVGDNKKWFGALYYDIVQKTVNGHEKYFLIGIDTNHPMSTKKVVDVLQFNDEGTPVLGAPLFQAWKPPHKKATRFIIEYKGDASVSLSYDEQRDKIIMDHLKPLTEKDEGIYLNYVPDGTFDALTWNNSQFVIEQDVVPTIPETESEQQESQKDSDLIYKSNSKND